MRNLVQFDFDARAGARGGFAGGAGQTRRAHVLDARDRAGGQQFEAGFANEFFHERIADLHRAALLLGGFLGQILRRKRRARQAVAARGRADVKNRIADALGRAARDLFVPQHAEAEGVHQRIAFVGFVEINLARDGRNAEAIAVMRDAGRRRRRTDGGCFSTRRSRLRSVAAERDAGSDQFRISKRAAVARRARYSSVIGPNRSEFTEQIGRAPIVKMSRTMPPTPVAAP